MFVIRDGTRPLGAVRPVLFWVLLIWVMAGFGGARSGALAAGGDTKAKPKPMAAVRDLSGIWQVRVTGSLVGTSLLCQAVPKLNHGQLDTVLKASTLKELFYAIVPDSSRAWFDSVCDPVFEGDQVFGTCRIPLTYARPCVLTADVTFRGRLTSDTQFTGDGEAEVVTGGPGFCPKTTCPGEVRITAQRVGDVPRAVAGKGKPSAR